MSVINQAVAAVIQTMNAGVLDDNRTATAAGTQGNAAAIMAAYTRFTVATNAATNTAILQPCPATGVVRYVVNDAANPVQVFCAAGDKLQGTTNGSISIPAGQSAIFVPVNPYDRVGTVIGAFPDWRVSVLT